MKLNRESLRRAYQGGGVRSLILAMKEAGYRRGRYRQSSAMEVIVSEGGDTLCVGADVSGRPEWRKLPAIDMK